MHVITRKRLLEFAEKHPQSAASFDRWYRAVKQAHYNSFAALRKDFPSADVVGELIVFNIGGNKYRLITAIHFNRGIVYIRHVLTHKEYNKNKWKND